jgi:NADPH:quinone reductase
VFPFVNEPDANTIRMMKAIEVRKTGGPEVLALVDRPIPRPKPNEALVQITAAGVNYIDVYLRDGRYPRSLPFICGQEASGVVVEVGAAVTSVKPGDCVAYTEGPGSYAEYAAVPADHLVRVPAGVDEQQAAAAMLQGLTAHYLSHSTYPLKPGDTALIHAAAGGTGLLLVQMAHHLGARVIATVSTEAKAILARESGADETILYTEKDFETETKRLTEGRGVDVVYDSVGQTTFAKGLNVLRPRGMMVLYGASSGMVSPIDPMVLSDKGSLFFTRPRLKWHVASRAELEQRAGDVLNMIAAGTLKIRIGKVYPLAAAAQAHRDLESRKTTGKLLLVPN